MVERTYKEAHEVKGENGRHTTKGQPLQHRTADAGTVAVILGAIVTGFAGGSCRAKGGKQEGKHLYCFIVLPGETGKKAQLETHQMDPPWPG